MPLHPYGRHADVPQVFARLRQQRAADERIDLFVRMPADHHVVLRLPLGEQFRIAVVAHVRHEYQHVALGPQLRGIFQGHRLRIGKLQPRETRFIARRMPRALVVGHHADKPDPDPVPVDDRVGRQLREGAGVAHHIGADHLEVHAVDHPPQERLPVVEFMVAQRRHVIPQFVHQGDHRHTGRRRHVHIGIPRPAVAGIDQHHHASTADASRGKFCIFACMSFVDSNTSVLSRGAQAAASAATATSPILSIPFITQVLVCQSYKLFISLHGFNPENL